MNGTFWVVAGFSSTSVFSSLAALGTVDLDSEVIESEPLSPSLFVQPRRRRRHRVKILASETSESEVVPGTQHSDFGPSWAPESQELVPSQAFQGPRQEIQESYDTQAWLESIAESTMIDYSYSEESV